MKGLYCFTFLCCTFSISNFSFGQSAGDFRSFGTGDWNNVNTWERFNGSSWVNPAPSTPTNADGAISVLHTVTVTANVSVDQVTVTRTGQLTINSSITLSVAAGTGTDLTVDAGGAVNNQGTVGIASGFGGSATVVVNGTINNGGSINGASTSRLSFGSGSTYDHQQNAGTVPISTWDTASTCRITGSTTAGPSGLNQTFAIFNWNTPNLSSGTGLYDAGFTSTTIFNGNFTIESTGTDILVLSDASTTLVFNADFSVTGSAIFAVTNAGSITADIAGDFIYSSTADSYFSNTGTGNINVAGNFSFTAGRLFIFDASGSGTLTFDGTTTQTFSDAGGTFDGDNDPSFVISGTNVTISGEGAFDGSGNFTVNATSTVTLASVNASGALQTGSTAGNIRVTGTRTFNSGATVVYSGASAQVIGNGYPSSGDVNLTINNTAGVNMNGNVAVNASRTLTLTSGNFSIGANTLTINGTISGSGTLAGGATSNLTIGGTGAFGTLSLGGGASELNNFTLERSSGSVTLGSSLSVLGTFTQTAGDLEIASTTLTLSGAYSRSGGNIGLTSASSLVINGSGALPASFAFTGTAMNTLTLNRASATLATGASITITTLNLTSGTFNNTGTITMASDGIINRTDLGSMNAAPAAASSYNVTYNISNATSTGAELPSGTTALKNLTKEGSATLTLSQAITVNGTLTFSSGTFNSSTHSVDIKGNVLSNATSQLTSSTITFSGTTTLDGTTAPTFANVTITGTVSPLVSYRINGDLSNTGTLNAGTVTTTFGGTTIISGSSTSAFNHLVINGSSTLTASTGSLNVGGDFTNNGTFNSNGGTVVFNGTTSIGGTSATDFANITISGTLTAPATLNLTGNFANNGTFVRGTGTVVFKGSSKQSISGTSVTDFNNISVTNTAGPPAVEIGSNQNLRGTLTLAANSIFDADGAGSAVFTVVSTGDNPTVDAGIATLPSGASVSGSVTVQRYMSLEGTNDRLYRYISSPVQTPAVSQIQSEIPVTGTFTGSSTCSGCGTSQSMFRYDESVITGDLNSGYVDFPDAANTETLALGKGYAIYIRGNVEPILSAGSARWDVRNQINSGTVNFPVTFNSSGDVNNDGWNLIGNPYPSTIDWNAASGWSKSSDLSGTIYMRDNGNGGVYATWNGTTSVNGGSRYIPMGQAFWVKSDGSTTPSLSANENVKTAGTQTIFFREASPSYLLRITLRQGSVRDESVIHFREDATETYDNHADAYKLRNQTFNLSSLASDKKLKLAINSLPKLTCGTTVNLDISDAANGFYQLDFSELESFGNDVNISVYDVFTDTRFDARTVTSYAFEVTSDSSSFGPDRFSVSFSYKTPGEASLEYPSQVCTGGEAIVNIVNSETYVRYGVYRNGRRVSEEAEGNGGSLQIVLSDSILAAGVNDLILQYSPVNCNSMVSSKQIQINSLQTPVVTTTDAEHCRNGSVLLLATGAEEGNYRWYDSETGNTVILGAVSGVFTTEVLNKSKTYYVSAVNALGCEGSRKEVRAIIHQYEEVTISVNDDQNILTSSYEAGNQWYFNGVPIPGAAGKTLEVNETGLYTVAVTINGCTTEASREMVVLAVEEDGAGKATLFPNPVKDKLTIELNENRVSTKASVYTSFGYGLGEIEFKVSGNKLVGKYNFEGQPAGVYFINLTYGNKVINYKIIKK
jgi:hypothetical protein